MTTLRALMDSVADADGLGPGELDLYAELAPVYEFVTERRLDYDAVASFVDAHAPDDASSVAVGACGGGLLLSRLADEHEEVVGFDRSRSMLDRCSGRTDAHLALADLTSFVSPGRFDVFTVLGGSIAHVPPRGDDGLEGVESVFENAYESLAPGGVFVCDFMESGTLENGTVVQDSYESDRYRVGRTVITTGERYGPGESGVAGRYTHAYEITDRQTDETVTVGTTSLVREFRTGPLLGVALAAGFVDVSLVSPPTHGTALVARRVE